MKKWGLDSFALHILAMALMLCDHLWATFCPNLDILGYLGRIAFPIFAFLLAEGFFRTADHKKYLLRLVIAAAVAELPFNLLVGHGLFYPIHQNVLWTFVLAMAMMLLLEKCRSKKLLLRALLQALTVLGFYLLGFITFVDYYGYGILTVALLYFTRARAPRKWYGKLLVMALQALALYWINGPMIKGLVLELTLFGRTVEIWKQSLAVLALLPIWLYNGKQGPHGKAVRWLYYGFYPLHAAILGALITWL